MKQLYNFLVMLIMCGSPVQAQYTAPCFNIASSKKLSLPMRSITVSKDTTISVNINRLIYGMTVSGVATLPNEKSFIRITLKDSYNYEHLVYENFRLLANDATTSFNGVGIETALLNGITPQSLTVHVENAMLTLSDAQYSTTVPSESYNTAIASIRSTQATTITDKLNQHLQSKNMTWDAGITSLSEMSYQEKKDLFGGEVPYMGGFEYYVSGIFVAPDYTAKNNAVTSPYVPEFDWRNRHGKNWITPVKNQSNCASCWAFCAIGITEAYINLYFNRLLNPDLSEQELVSCSWAGDCSGGSTDLALAHITNYGVVNEECFPYTATNNNCNNKCQNPNVNIKIGQYDYLNKNALNTDNLKARILKSPLGFVITSWNHSLPLIGYKSIREGDKVYIKNNLESRWTTITAGNSLIGSTAWLIKNSWGSEWGNNGYAYVVIDWSDISSIYKLSGKVTSLSYSDSDIVCQDNDGDGYYFWGIGSKPASLPSWIPNEPDGDDSDANVGPMNHYGYLQDLNPDLLAPVNISSTTIWNSDKYLHTHLNVNNRGKLTVSATISMYKDAKITVKSGGELIINGVTIKRADVTVEPGGKLTLKSGGTIEKETDDEVDIQQRATFNQEEGDIF